ncbi:hypothetical protein DFP73DRAFT_532284 [Morchella snyderi]|nr:hypothetical protein DFP73DRAFT_532284 [Morchella snyderi]
MESLTTHSDKRAGPFRNLHEPHIQTLGHLRSIDQLNGASESATYIAQHPTTNIIIFALASCQKPLSIAVVIVLCLRTVENSSLRSSSVEENNIQEHDTDDEDVILDIYDTSEEETGIGQSTGMPIQDRDGSASLMDEDIASDTGDLMYNEEESEIYDDSDNDDIVYSLGNPESPDIRRAPHFALYTEDSSSVKSNVQSTRS